MHRNICGSVHFYDELFYNVFRFKVLGSGFKVLGSRFSAAAGLNSRQLNRKKL
jgi:hypothetical protein